YADDVSFVLTPASGSPVRTITYDQITSLPSDNPLDGNSSFNVLSASGNRAVFRTSTPAGDRIYTVNGDGTGLTLIDPDHEIVGPLRLDISADGSVVLEPFAP